MSRIKHGEETPTKSDEVNPYNESNSSPEQHNEGQDDPFRSLKFWEKQNKESIIKFFKSLSHLKTVTSMHTNHINLSTGGHSDDSDPKSKALFESAKAVNDAVTDL